jgi:uncharacterized protein YdeI (YjbR/CyaY-like superfamily)
MAALPPKPFLDVDSATRWRCWLKNNCVTSTEIWLGIRKKGARCPGIDYEDAVREALCFGWIDGKMKSVNEDLYVLRFSPRRRNSVWSRVNRVRAEKLIEAGKMEQPGFEAIEQARANGQWENAYSSREPPDVPSDLQQALARSPEARKNFEAMSNSHRLMYTRWVLEAKRPQTRERRIAEVLRRAEQNQRPGEQ